MTKLSKRYLFCWCLCFGLLQSWSLAQPPELIPQTGHSRAINGLAFSPDGRWLASGGIDPVIVWELATGRELRTLVDTRAHSGMFTMKGINAMAPSPDGLSLAVANSDGSVKLWDVATGRELRTLSGQGALGSAFFALAFSPGGRWLAGGGGGGTIRVWEVKTGETYSWVKQSLQNPPAVFQSVVFSPDGHWLAAGSKDGTIKMWDAKGTPGPPLAGAGSGVKSLAFNRDGSSLISFSEDGVVQKWDVLTGHETQSRLPSAQAKAESFNTAESFNPDGSLLAIGDNDGAVKLLDLTTFQERTLGKHGRWISKTVFSPDGKLIASASEDGVIKLWDVKARREQETLQNHIEMISAVAFSGNGLWFASASLDKTIKVWSLTTGQQVRILTGHLGALTSLAFNLRGSMLASGDSNGSVKVWDVATGKELHNFFYDNRQFIVRVAFTYTGEFVVAASRGGKVQAWELTTEKPLDLPSLTGLSEDIALSHDTRWAAGSQAETVLVWNLLKRDKASPLALYRHDSFVRSLAFSNTGRWLASGSDDNTVRLQNLATLKPPYMLADHTGTVWALAFRPDDYKLASGADDNTVKLWDTTTGNLQGTLIGHSGGIRSLAFSNHAFPISADPVIGSGATDGSVRLWDSGLFKQIAALFSLDQGDWVVTDLEGRFDANELDRIGTFHWVFTEDPFRALSPEIFMRDYYEPRLLARLLAGEKFKPVPPLQSLNRIQPEVKILRVRPGQEVDEVLVDAQALGREGNQPNGKTKTAAYDLRLFRDRQLVGQWPTPEHGTAGPQDLAEWRRVSAVPTRTHTFRVRLATRDRGKAVTFTAYAFNEDRVKSETAQATYSVPQDIPTRKARAYVITIGVNGYENSHRNLEFAVKDAEDMAFALRQIKEYEVVPVSLLSEAPKAGAAMPVSQATKAKIRAVLGILAGSSDHTALSGVANADKLVRATPDDLVILSFSGHGHTEPGGAFYLLPSDSGKEDAVTPASLKKFISSEELSEWLRQVDAGQMAMIIDACHSAASVETPGFKPGPMGDRGLGQLAYDKGMRILAASQADDVSLEIQNLQQGLLTYALVWDGLRAGEGGKLRADLNGDGKITLEEWLKYGEQRVPSLYEDAKAGKVKMVSRDSTVNSAFFDANLKRAQTPSLFDFRERDDNVVLLVP